jgi:hypothetical protein
MAGGALYQITTYNTNAVNNFLELDPQISFFKIVYRKYTRFAIENIKFDNLSRNKLAYDSNIIITADIPRNSDLLKKLYFTFELPAIYSGSYTNNNNTTNYEFKWIKNIGLNIFNYVKLIINGLEIDTLYSDYINIWKELFLNEDEKNNFNKNIGHIPEIYNPKDGLGQNGIYPNITTSTNNTIQAEKYYNNNSQIISFSNKTDYTFPSIQSYKIKVPLPFSFFINSGLALPLVALQYSVLSLEFEMKKFQDLYTIIDAKFESSSNSYGKRIKPSSETHHKITNFTSDFDFNIKPNIEGEYIFLDDNERTRFALNDHEYLIEQHKIVNKDGTLIKPSIEETDEKISPAFNPIKYLTWIVKRDDSNKLNNWTNYTNWVDEDVPPYSNQHYYAEKYYNMTDSKDVFFNPKVTAHKSLFNIVNLKKNILTNVRIEFDGNTRIDKGIEYYEKQQIYDNFKTNPKDGIFVYSFSINPKEYQPSGCCNFSSIENPKIYYTKLIQESFTQYNYRAYLFIINYNIFLIKSGIGGLKFVS